MSEQATIPFNNQQASGFEDIAGGSPIAKNVVIDGLGAVRRRPGIDLYSNEIISAGISGLYATLNGSVFAVDNDGVARSIYKVGTNNVLDLSASDNARSVMGLDRPQFAETEMLLVIAGGREMQKLELASLASSRLGGGAPQASHVVGMSSRLVANDLVVDRTKVRYSDIAQGTVTFAGHETWLTGTSGFFTAEARPDPVVALGESTNELFVFGSQTTQVYSADATLVFAPAVTLEVGCGAAYSPIKVDQQFFWLDDRRRIVMSAGRQFEVISDPIRRTLEEMSEVSDCYGYRVLIGAYDCLVWTFPSDGRTFVFQRGSGWGIWEWADDVTAHALTPSGGNLVGTTGGKIGKFSLASQGDFDIPNQAYVQTGYINHKTDARKHCRSVNFSLRRGKTQGNTPVAQFGWRDQPGPWEAILEIDLGATGDTEIVVQFHSLGIYRRRQWFFEFSGADELVLVSATESFDFLDN